VRRSAALAMLVGCLAALAAWPGLREGLEHVSRLLAAADLTAVRDYLRSFGAWAPLTSVALMQVQAVIAPLPSLPLMYANGLLFGTLWGGLLSWVSILASAVLCFGLARVLGRPLVERLVRPTALAWADQVFVRSGPFALFLGRLIPLSAFDLLSYAAGLTPMRLGPFCIATGLGMTPAVFLTAAAGDAGVRSPWTLVAGVLVIGALAAGAALLRPPLVRWFGRTRAVPSPEG